MTYALKNSLLMLAVAVATVAQTSNANAQADPGLTIGPLRTVTTMPPTMANAGEANAILDLATGEVIIQFSAGIQVFEIAGIPFDNAAAVAGLTLLDPANPLIPGSEPLQNT